MEQLSITNHAMERYAKRIANRETTIDVNTYVQLNKDKITEDINTMIHFGNRIYTGRVGQREERPVNVYLSGTWVILTDILDKTVITVYKVNLGLDEEFNKTFINGILKRMEEHKAELAEAQKQTEEAATANGPQGKEESKNPAQFTRIYQFSSLDLVCEAARQTGAVFKGNSVLYKNPENGVFYLILKKENDSESSFNRVCNTLSEYGTRLKGDAAASGAYYAEHYDVIVKKDALKVLQNL